MSPLVTAVVFSYSSSVNVAGVPSRAAAQVKAAYAIASHLGGEVADRAHIAFVGGMHIALLTAAVAAMGAAVAVTCCSRDARAP